jgi:hypothetical protein
LRRERGIEVLAWPSPIWKNDATVETMVRDHSWDARAALYDELFAEARDTRLEA